MLVTCIFFFSHKFSKCLFLNAVKSRHHAGNDKLFPKRQSLDSFKLKEFAYGNFEFEENGRKFSKKVEKSVGKREIARHEQFLLFPQCFQKTADT